MKEFSIQGIPALLVSRMWHYAEPYVKRALDHSSGEVLATDLKRSCEDRNAQLWLVSAGDRVVGACITEIVDYPQRKHCIVLTIGGARFPEWMDQLDALLSAWATSQGCEVLEAHVRRGLVPRLSPLGYKHLHSIVYKPLRAVRNAAQQPNLAEA